MSNYGDPYNTTLRDFVSNAPRLLDTLGREIPGSELEELLVFAMGSAPVSVPPYGLGIGYVRIKEVMGLTRAELIAKGLEYGQNFGLTSAYRVANYVLEHWKSDPQRYTHHLWMLWAAGIIGGDMIVLDLMACFNEHRSRIKNQNDLLNIIRGLGTNMTYTLMLDLKHRNWFAGKSVDRFIDKKAKREGIDREVWLDQHVPTCGLGARGLGARSLGDISCGAHHYRLVIGESLVPRLRDEDGALSDEIPEDLEGATIAERRDARLLWNLARQQLETTIPIQVARLEKAMLEERIWSVASWKTLFTEHPLLRVLSEHALWGVFDLEQERLLESFRVAQDMSLANLEDETYELPEGDHIGIRVVHPAHFTKQEKSAWVEIFVDYEMIELFPQVSRPTWPISSLPARASEIELLDYDEKEQSFVWSIMHGRGWKHRSKGRRMTFFKSFGDLKASLVATSPLKGEHRWVFKGLDFHIKGERKAIDALEQLPVVGLSELLVDLDMLLAQ